jgi:hypothetical protein
VLRLFLESPKRLISRAADAGKPRRRAGESFDRAMDVRISRLRTKLGEDPKQPAPDQDDLRRGLHLSGRRGLGLSCARRGLGFSDRHGIQIDLQGTRFSFPSLKTLLAKATPARSGDALAGLAADGPVERLAAQLRTGGCAADRFPGHRRAGASRATRSQP